VRSESNINNRENDELLRVPPFSLFSVQIHFGGYFLARTELKKDNWRERSHNFLVGTGA
jgi:hypothetical protein